MRGKVFLAAFLLGVGLCFVPALGYGKVEWRWLDRIDYWMLKAEVSQIRHNPNTFLNVEFVYDESGLLRISQKFPEGVDTKGKIGVIIGDTRGAFSYKSEVALLGQFKKVLEPLCSYIESFITDIDTDIVAKFLSGDYIPLGYFYQGEYHLWEK